MTLPYGVVRKPSSKAPSHYNYFIIIKANLSRVFSIHGSTYCLRTNEHTHTCTLPKAARRADARTPQLVSHPYSAPLNWGPWHMVGARAAPPPLYGRYKFRIGFNTPIPRWPTRLTQLLCWMCHTQTQRHTLWCNPITTNECWREFFSFFFWWGELMQNFVFSPMYLNKNLTHLNLTLNCHMASMKEATKRKRKKTVLRRL